jgi:hypothetical protein
VLHTPARPALREGATRPGGASREAGAAVGLGRLMTATDL